MDSAGDYVLIIKATKANQGYTSGTLHLSETPDAQRIRKVCGFACGRNRFMAWNGNDISAKVMDINGGTWLDSDIEYMIEQSGDVVSISGGKLITEEIGQARWQES